MMQMPSPPSHDEPMRAVARHALSLATARARYNAGEPITLVYAPNATAASWQYATVRANETTGAPEMKGDGNRWGPVESSDGVHAQAGLAACLFLLSTDKMTAPPSVYLFGSVPCAKCNRPLTTPLSYGTGLGPDCGGRYDGMRERSAARRNLWRNVAFNVNAHASDRQSPPAMLPPAPPTRARCPGTCDPREYCADCDK